MLNLKRIEKRGLFPLFILGVFIFMITPVSAIGCPASGFFGNFQLDSDVIVTETCPTCTFINITIKNTLSEQIIINQPMVLSEGIFSYTIGGGNNSEIGTYWIEGHSNLDDPFKACYDITTIKIQASTSESILYTILVTLSLLLFSFSLWGAIVLPFSNSRNELGRVLSITWVKYLKVTFIVLVYLFMLWTLNLGVSITNNLVSLTQFSGFFEMMFNLMMAIAWPFFVVVFLFVNVALIKDLQLNKLLQRGLSPR